MRLSILSLFFLALTACAPKPSGLEDTPKWPALLHHTETETILSTAYAWTEATHRHQAQQLVDAVIPQSEAEQSMASLVHAKQAFYRGNLRQAHEYLQNIPADTLPPIWQFYFFDTKAIVLSALGNGTQGLGAHLNALNMLPPEIQMRYLKRIRHTLDHTPLSGLKPGALPSSQQWDAHGWVQLKWLSEQPTQPLASWYQRFDQHPARMLLHPHSAQLWPTSIKRIGVLLPQQGPYHRAAQAIKTGLIAAYYANQHALSLTFIDTSAHNWLDVMDHGAFDALIGPLSKEKVDLLCHTHRKLPPTLALNTTLNGHCNHPAVYPWQLSAQHDIPTVVDYLERHGLESILILSTNTTSAQRLAKQFKQAWSKEHREPLQTTITGNSKQRAAQIHQTLDIAASEQRYQAISQAFSGQAIRFMAQPRQDIQAIFLAMNEAEASKIVPLLHYYFVGNLPMIGTSNLHTSTIRSRSHDLHGIIWPQSQWLAQKKPPTALKKIVQTLQKEVPTLYQKAPIFLAIGVDALALCLNLHKLIENPTQPLDGLSGKLYITNMHQVTRHLKWYRNQQGHTQPLHPSPWHLL